MPAKDNLRCFVSALLSVEESKNTGFLPIRNNFVSKKNKKAKTGDESVSLGG